MFPTDKPVLNEYAFLLLSSDKVLNVCDGPIVTKYVSKSTGFLIKETVFDTPICGIMTTSSFLVRKYFAYSKP